jgi:hypothetical protein
MNLVLVFYQLLGHRSRRISLVLSSLCYIVLSISPVPLHYPHPHVKCQIPSILGLLKPCLEKAAAVRSWKEKRQKKGEGRQRVGH